MRNQSKKTCAVCHIDQKSNPNGTMYSDGPVKWRMVGKDNICSMPCSQEARMMQKMNQEPARA